MSNNYKQCFNTHYQPHCHPTTKSLWLCSSVYCGPPHQSRRIWLAAEAANQKWLNFGHYWICRCPSTWPLKVKHNDDHKIRLIHCIAGQISRHVMALRGLTHRGRDKMTAKLQSITSRAISSVTISLFRTYFHESMFLRVRLMRNHHLFR